MAGAGYLLFTAGQVLTAAQVNTYLNQQAVMVFATTAARDSALTSVKSEGMVTYQLDNNDLDIYNGSTFSTLIQPCHGGWIAFDPVVTQSGAVTHTVSNSTYQRIGRGINWRWTITCTGAGSAANVVTLSLPANILYVGDFGPCGHFQIYDTSANQHFSGPATGAAAGTIKGYSVYPSVSVAPTFLGVTLFTAALASGDVLSGWVSYEAASDA